MLRRSLCLVGLLSLGCQGSAAGSPAADGGGGADAAIEHIDRSGLTDVGIDAPLDYANPALWMCRPGIDANECHRNLDTTEIRPDGTQVVVPHVRAQQPKFDCFYVLPTMLLSGAAQLTDLSDSGVQLALDALLAQAARFSRVCEVYAPMYRQAGLAGGALAPGANTELALQDVRDSFAYYLAHFNRGRNFVILGHSQGSYHLTTLLRRDMDENAARRGKLISAVLLGAQPYVPPGERVGGSFANIPTCSEPGETGCLIAYSSYAAEAPPTSGALFGMQNTSFSLEPIDPQGQVVCTEPAHLAGNEGRFSGAYFPIQLFNKGLFATEVVPPAGVTTPYLTYRELFRGHCRLREGYSYLEVALDPPDGDLREPPVYRSPLLESFGFGMHLVDYNLPLDDLIEAVTLQAAAMP